MITLLIPKLDARKFAKQLLSFVDFQCTQDVFFCNIHAEISSF